MLVRVGLMVLSLSLAGAADGGTQKKGAADTKKPESTEKAGAAASGPTAILHTTAGDIKCQLFPKQAPKTVENFIGLASGTKDWTNPTTGKTEHGKPLYDGTIFHRVIPGFMVQGGDPLGTGSGNPGYKFGDEFDPSLTFDQPGRLAMANAGPGTNGSQFFITDVPTPWLNNHHTIFGQCDQASVAIVKKIEGMPCQGGQSCTPYNSKLQDPVKINHIEIQNASGSKSTASGHKSTKTTQSSSKK